MAGVLLGISVYFGQDAAATLAVLLSSQLSDGGWNCQRSPVGSFHSTICAVEGLLAWERSADPDDPLLPTARAARLHGEGYLLERRLLRRRTTGELVDPRFTMLSYPVRWYYDVLRALEYLRRARPQGDLRMWDAVELLRPKSDPEGRWRLENKHKGSTPFYMDREREGEPSRWVTLRALRVLRWADAIR
jgi:hypothetical protein